MKLNPATERPDTFEDVMEKPELSTIGNASQQAVFANEILEKVSIENFDSIVTYIMRPEFSNALEIFLMMAICRKNPQLYCDSKVFVRWAKENKALSL